MARLLTKIRALVPRRRIVVRLGMGILVLLLFLVVSAEFTSRPKFCTSCHYMEPYYESWTLSSHKEVTCVNCHFPPGLEGTIRGKMAGLIQVVNYLGRSYTRRKPWAEIEDTSCLQSGCHDTRLLEGNVPFKGVVFDHEAHLGELRRGKQLRCTSCHSQVVQGEHILVTETTCFLCHMKKGEDVAFTSSEKLGNCKTCHDWSAIPEEHMPDFRFDHTEVVKQDLDCTRCHNKTVVGDGFVPQENCVSCHFEAERLAKYEDHELLHRVHIAQNKIECVQCHLTIQHKIQRVTPDAELECTTCHDNTHKEQLFLFTGKDESGHQSTPNPMFEVGLNCASCHVFHEQLLGNAEVRKASSQSCESCHGEGYARLLRLWEETADTKLVRLNREINSVESTVRKAGPARSKDALADIERAKQAMHLVEVGKAVHNITFADQLIIASYESLEEASKKAGVTYQLPAEISPSTTVPSECANCHTGVEALEVPHQGKQFSHNVHVVDQHLECKTCHSNAKRHGELILTSQDCNSCHHRPAAVSNCTPCHETETAFYAGTYFDRHLPDYMYDSDIACVDCHVSENKIRRPDATICVDCHDDEYVATAEAWKQEVQALSREVRSLLDKASPAFKRTKDYNEAQSVLNGVEQGSAHGIHNYELTTELLNSLKKTLENPAPGS